MGPYSCMGLTCKEKPPKADMGAALGLSSRAGSRKLPGGGEGEIGTTKPSLSVMGVFWRQRWGWEAVLTYTGDGDHLGSGHDCLSHSVTIVAVI